MLSGIGLGPCSKVLKTAIEIGLPDAAWRLVLMQGNTCRSEC